MNNELIDQLQQLMHQHGLKSFVQNLQQSAYRASEDTEHINKDISEDYQSFAQIIDLDDFE